MKDGIHPEYREVIFQDLSMDFSFKTRSTVHCRDKVTWTDGKEYPLYKLDITSESHPFYTGKQKVMDTAGRIDKFRQRFGNRTGKIGG
ncbi:type B 50S ribosomal protein L31 [Derxia lacustris]|uniref:type B 50S ribosomal protein L31 n=1 Tax=Derxia lacustris TaxID=764842 RepID=UPI000A178466|nr:type B 50S ribosomal protein L31 [Derxia lacustris]